MRIYNVKSTNTAEELMNIEDMVTDRNHTDVYENWKEFSEIANDENSYDIDEFESIMFLSDDLLVRFLRSLMNVGYKIEIQDVTNDLFYGNYDISMASDEFKNTVKNYLYSNYDKNDVLDKMLEVKDYQLNEYDLNILQTN